MAGDGGGFRIWRNHVNMSATMNKQTNKNKGALAAPHPSTVTEYSDYFRKK